MEDGIHYDTVVEIKQTESALKTKTFKIVKFFLSTISAWPGDELGQPLHWLAKFYRAYLPLQCFVMWIGEIHYMTVNDLDYLRFGEAMAAWLLTTVEVVRLSIPLLARYREVIRDFLMSFHLIHFKYKGNHFEKIHKKVEKACYYFTLYIAITMLCGCMLFNVSPLYINYRNGLLFSDRQNVTFFELSLYYSCPIFSPYDHFKLVTFLNTYYSYNCTICVCVIDLLVILMTFHVIGHISILRKNLEEISGPGKTDNLQFEKKNRTITVQYTVYSKEENEKISFTLKDCVNHHRFIVRFTDKMSDFFGIILVVNYGFQLISLCILLLESTSGGLDAYARFGPLTLIIFGQLIQISVAFEIVSTVSEKLPESLYAIPWECMDIRNQRTMCILLQRLQSPIHVTAMGMTSVGVNTMAGILKTTFSYFMFLRSISV